MSACLQGLYTTDFWLIFTGSLWLKTILVTHSFLISLNFVSPWKRRLGTQLLYGTSRSLACKGYSLLDIPLPFSLLPDELHYICSQERITTVVH